MTEICVFTNGSSTSGEFPGLVNFSRFKSWVQNESKAHVRASAFVLKLGFPVLVDSGQDLVPGQLLRMRGSEILLPWLDELHGCSDSEFGLTERKAKEVLTEEGPLTAWVYFVKKEKLTKEAIPVPHGNWPDFLEKYPPLPLRLTLKQKEFVLKLGKADLREQGTLDLNLYRDLLKLEIIVDKGRRVALSKLGHEVFEHLNSTPTGG